MVPLPAVWKPTTPPCWSAMSMVCAACGLHWAHVPSVPLPFTFGCRFVTIDHSPFPHCGTLDAAIRCAAAYWSPNTCPYAMADGTAVRCVSWMSIAERHAASRSAWFDACLSVCVDPEVAAASQAAWFVAERLYVPCTPS